MDVEIIPPGQPLPDIDAKLRQLDALADLLDSRFILPGTNISLGIDALIGLIPVIGDTLGVLISSYLVKLAHELGVPGHVKLRMGANIFMDWLIGLVPFIGDAFDIGWKANRRNAKLVRNWLAKKGIH